MKITTAPLAAALVGTEALPIVQAGQTRRLFVATLLQSASAAGSTAGNVAAKTQADLAESARSAAAAAADRAQLGATTALLNGHLYATVNAGLAATAEGQPFAVRGTGDVYATAYLKAAGAPELVGTFPSKAALDRLGRVIVADPAADNAIAINAALADPAVGTVHLPAGNIRVDTGIHVPSGKHLKGAGRGLTRLIRTGNVNDGVSIRTVPGAIGVRISDFDYVANDSIQGIWMRQATFFEVERVNMYNAHYNFWAQEYSRLGAFRDCGSYNANVHCEATQAYDITFDTIDSGDGAGNNPSGVEAVWHPLLGSRRITFRNCTHTGKGIPFLIVGNDINGDPLGGLIDDIRYENCRAVMTENKFAFHVFVYNGQIGRIYFDGCAVNNEVAGVLGLITKGNIRMRDCEIATGGVEGFEVQPDASLVAVNTDVEVKYSADLNKSGGLYGPYNNVRMIGGSVKVTPPGVQFTPVRGGAYASPDAQFINVSPLNVLTLGRVGRVVFPEYTSPPTGDTRVAGYGQSQAAQFHAALNHVYRVTFRGNVRSNTGANVGLYLDASSGLPDALTYGDWRIEKADGTMASYPTHAVAVDIGSPNQVRRFEIDITIVGKDASVPFMLQGSNQTLLAGAELTVERIA
ncbi:MAG TPA: hypothetical protein VF680_01425 [Allosphingosinicella sp.]|jgi:hypothetical protein